MIPEDLVGQQIDITPFGRIRYWTGTDPMTIEGHDITPQENGGLIPMTAPEQGGMHIGVEWEYPRQFSRLLIRFTNAEQIPFPDSARIQYWQRNWPPAYHGGWTAVDDPYNGQWVTARCEIEVEGDTWNVTFDPLDITELPHAEDFSVAYRQSYRVRLLFRDGSVPEIGEFQVFSDSVWQVADLEIRFEPGFEKAGYEGGLDIHNGYILSMDDSDGTCIKAKVLFAETHNDGVNLSVPWEPDRTVVTVKADPQAFSFLVTDVLTGDVEISDWGVHVGNGVPAIPQSTDCTQPGGSGTAGKPFPTIYDRILTEPEQTHERASREIPQVQKTTVHPHGRYVPIGCEANRQEFAIRYNGEIFADKHELKLMGRDAARLRWPGTSIFYKFPTGDPPDFRYREDGTEQSAMNGYLPVYASKWKDREFAYEMTSFAALLNESPWDEEQKRGDEPIVALSRVRIRNTTEERRTARFWMVIESPEELAVDGGFIYATGRARDDRVPDAPVQKRWTVRQYTSRRLRALIDTKGKGEAKAAPCAYEPLGVTGIPNAIAYNIELEPGTSHEIDLFIPFVTFTGDDGRDQIKSLDYDAKLAEMTDYWQKQIDAGGQIAVPEQDITDFVKATIPHIGITADKDIESGYYMLPAGTWAYPVCMNEACHQIRSLDYRGHHERARRYLRPFYELQGTQGMHGRFQSKEGVFHGLRTGEGTDYQGFNYNLDHGYVMFAMCEHYKFTRDREWLGSVADRLVAACDFVTRERRATMKTDATGQRVWEYGLLPPGHLEDNPEWLYWYAVNGYCYRGMKASSEVLADIGHAEAERLARDAAAYREDIQRAMVRSSELAPVVRLADGTFTPMVPTRCQLRGRDIGWIRDSLYGALHTIECGVVEPFEDLATWMLEDTEDNVFVSRYRGRQVDLERFWFSQGGNTIQSGLLPIVMIYLKRGQAEHAIRALFNGFAQNIYRDVRCFIEHPVEAFGLGAGPFYKTPDENCWINWLRNCLLMEQGDQLVIAPGTPRAWFAQGFSAEGMATYFGPMGYSVSTEGDRIMVSIEPPKRNPPSVLDVHLRHPEKKLIKSVEVNGQPYSNFGPYREIVRLTDPASLPERVEIVASY